MNLISDSVFVLGIAALTVGACVYRFIRWRQHVRYMQRLRRRLTEYS